MSLNSAFASNLRKFCSSRDSIAEVCRATKINRQQFNRYLAGKTLPNRKTREKICCYFGVDEGELFDTTSNQVSSKSLDSALWPEAELRTSLALLSSEAPASIPEGIYFSDFAIPHDESSIMRSAVVIRRDGNLTTFRRITGRSERRGSWWSNFDGDHRGIVLDRRHSLYFVALNTYGHREPTLLVLHWLPSTTSMLGGHGAIVTPTGPSITAVVLHPCPRSTSLRAAVEASHVYSTNDPRIDPIIVDTLDLQCKKLVGMVRHLDLSVAAV